MSLDDGRLATSLCGIVLRNPVLAASGTFGYGLEFERLLDLNALGGLVVKGLSREPMEGNPPPRIWEAEAGMLNSIGLQNIGVRAFVRDKLPRLARFRTAVFANVFGYAAEDYVEVVRVLDSAEGLAGYELNVSCPNTKHGGIFFSSEPALLAERVIGTKRSSQFPEVLAGVEEVYNLEGSWEMLIGDIPDPAGPVADDHFGLCARPSLLPSFGIDAKAEIPGGRRDGR